MAGSVRKSDMYAPLRIVRFLPDWSSIRLWFFEVADRRNDTILAATAEHMQRKGITLTDSVRYCRDQMAPAGTLTRRQPSWAAPWHWVAWRPG